MNERTLGQIPIQIELKFNQGSLEIGGEILGWINKARTSHQRDEVLDFIQFCLGLEYSLRMEKHNLNFSHTVESELFLVGMFDKIFNSYVDSHKLKCINVSVQHTSGIL